VGGVLAPLRDHEPASAEAEIEGLVHVASALEQHVAARAPAVGHPVLDVGGHIHVLHEEEAQAVRLHHQATALVLGKGQARAPEEVGRAGEELALGKGDREAHAPSPEAPERLDLPLALLAARPSEESPEKRTRAPLPRSLRASRRARPTSFAATGSGSGAAEESETSCRWSSRSRRSRPSMNPTAGSGRPNRATRVS